MLVGGWATPPKNMKINWDDYKPNISGKIKFMATIHHQPASTKSMIPVIWWVFPNIYQVYHIVLIQFHPGMPPRYSTLWSSHWTSTGKETLLNETKKDGLVSWVLDITSNWLYLVAWLVVFRHPSEIWVSWDDEIPKIWKKNKNDVPNHQSLQPSVCRPKLLQVAQNSCHLSVSQNPPHGRWFVSLVWGDTRSVDRHLWRFP